MVPGDASPQEVAAAKVKILRESLGVPDATVSEQLPVAVEVNSASQGVKSK
jgi:hypothetical protein